MCCRAIFFGVLVACIGMAAGAQTTYSVTTTADTFVATGSPDNPAGTNLTGLNYGAAGVLFVAPATSTNGEFESLLRFDLSGATNVFNTAYGTNNWAVSGISLKLTSVNGGQGENPMNTIFPTISGGNFVIERLSDNNWAEGAGTPMTPATNGVTYDSLPGLLSGASEILCTNTYTPPGDNVPVTYPLPFDTNVVAEVMSGGEVTFLLYAADNQISYLFNSYNYGRGNQPLINVTVNFTPSKILGGYFTNGGFQLSGSGIPNMSCQIQTTTNLTGTNWLTLGTVSSDGAGLIQFTDTNGAAQNGRFYRLSQ
jgi:hypothetical protein